MFPREPLGDRAQGQWRSILSECGLPSKSLVNRHGPCPMCGGKDRFRFDDKGGRGTWFCNQCGNGDGIELVKQFNRCDFKAAAAMIEQAMGAAPAPVTRGDRQAKSDQPTSDALKKLWARAKPVTADDPVGRYLARRCGLTDFPPSLRFAADERYADPGGPPPIWLPTMVAKVDPSDEAASQGERAVLHRTYLTKDGLKADVPTPRKMLGNLPRGAAVRLMPHDDTLGIAEGIETAFSASALYNVPCWAALTADLLKEWSPPANVKHVFVFGDNDASATGQAVSWTLTRRLRAKGLDVIVEFPTRVGEDFNDVHSKSLEAA